MSAKTIEEMNILGQINGEPIKSYTKTILGKIYVMVLDRFSGQPVGILLSGDPRKQDDGSIVEIFSEVEDIYFRKANKRHFEVGNIIPFTKKVEPKERTIEEYSDEELTVLVNQKFLALQHTLNKTVSVAVLFRMLNLAEANDKSEKIISAIKARISEVQMQEVTPNRKQETQEK
jgi:hypothetical protein